MMDGTLAQIFNHVVELEIENMQLKEQLRMVQQGEPLPEGALAPGQMPAAEGEVQPPIMTNRKR